MCSALMFSHSLGILAGESMTYTGKTIIQPGTLHHSLPRWLMIFYSWKTPQNEVTSKNTLIFS